MKRMTLPLLLAAFCFCHCSDSQKSPSKSSDSKGGSGAYKDASYIAKDYKLSLQQHIIDILDIKDIKTLLCQQWEHQDDKNEAQNYGSTGSFTMVYRGLVFFNDGTVVRNPRGYISFGTWKYNDADKIISINLKDGDAYRYKIKAVAADELQLIDLDEASPKVETYVAQAFCYRKNSDDPFYAANNQWRIKPSRAETPAQISKRVKDCVRFYGLFYNDNLLRDTAMISFVGLPSCFSWYNSGIGVQMADKLSDEWIDCFYDKAQALKAHAILEDLITQKYNWTRGDFDWRVKTAKVLQQMNERANTLAGDGNPANK
jgi:hypothetical protein